MARHSNEGKAVEITIAVTKQTQPGDALVVDCPAEVWEMIDSIYCSDCCIEPLPSDLGIYVVKAEWWGSYDHEYGVYDEWGWTVTEWQALDLGTAVRGETIKAPSD